jgi:glycosyltransferase involved in cell wall biosynthesis
MDIGKPYLGQKSGEDREVFKRVGEGKEMRVELVLAPHEREIPGGTYVLAKSIGQALSSLGVETNINFSLPHHKVGDIIHFFSCGACAIEYGDELFSFLKDLKSPFVVHSVFWPSLSILKRSLAKPFIYFRNFPLFPKVNWARVALFLEKADLVITELETEMKFLTRYFPFVREKTRVVYDGINERFSSGDPCLFRDKFGINYDFVLNPALIHPRKNQLRLIKALKGSHLPLIILGKAGDGRYYEMCKNEAGNEVLFIEALPHDSPLLASAYASAKVVALPSLYESVGFSAIEGFIAGANVVVTKNSGTKEYLGENAYYVNPFRLKSIREGILSAWDAQIPNREEKIRDILQRFTWRKTAEELLRLYEEILSKGKGKR